ncbi:MAG: YceI family protein [Myxococcales bacterium]|jgi:polyisoprenoid-binding protein YceI|nr:YceI family protein [Myxococcales bacterium]HQY63319.1 YceI family protein [Polyangiaceae bacterium]
MTTNTPTWTLDPSHSSATFSVRHMMITNVRGGFQKLSGRATFDPANLEGASVEASIDVASIDTRDEKRDAHLRSADFFDVDRHPAITFTSKAVRRAGAKLELVGDLTLRGTTREVVLEVDGPTPEHVDPWGNTRIGAEAKTKIKRSEFGMTWNSALEAGGVLVGDEVTLSLDVSLVRQK